MVDGRVLLQLGDPATQLDDPLQLRGVHQRALGTSGQRVLAAGDPEGHLRWRVVPGGALVLRRVRHV